MEEFGNGNFFEDLLDFPNDIDGGEAVDIDAFPPVWLEEEFALSAACGGAADAAERTGGRCDIFQLDWLSNFVQDSYSKVRPLSISHLKRARSKRPRPSTFTPRVLQLIPHTYFAESHQWNRKVGQPKKKRKTNSVLETGASVKMSQDQNVNPNATVLRKCTHCEIMETPQWRQGPMGPKTLCNACGVQYMKGRLFPEYRPATSPTFIPSLHSNSHRKILELRKSKTPEEQSVMTSAATSCQPELIAQTIRSKTAEETSDLTEVAISWQPELPLPTRNGKITEESVKSPAVTNYQPEHIVWTRESKTIEDDESVMTVAATNCQPQHVLQMREGKTTNDESMIMLTASCQPGRILKTSKTTYENDSSMTVAATNFQPKCRLQMREGKTTDDEHMMTVASISCQPEPTLQMK